MPETKQQNINIFEEVKLADDQKSVSFSMTYKLKDEKKQQNITISKESEALISIHDGSAKSLSVKINDKGEKVAIIPAKKMPESLKTEFKDFKKNSAYNLTVKSITMTNTNGIELNIEGAEDITIGVAPEEITLTKGEAKESIHPQNVYNTEISTKFIKACLNEKDDSSKIAAATGKNIETKENNIETKLDPRLILSMIELGENLSENITYDLFYFPTTKETDAKLTPVLILKRKIKDKKELFVYGNIESENTRFCKLESFSFVSDFNKNYGLGFNGAKKGSAVLWIPQDKMDKDEIERLKTSIFNYIKIKDEFTQADGINKKNFNPFNGSVYTSEVGKKKTKNEEQQEIIANLEKDIEGLRDQLAKQKKDAEENLNKQLEIIEQKEEENKRQKEEAENKLKDAEEKLRKAEAQEIENKEQYLAELEKTRKEAQENINQLQAEKLGLEQEKETIRQEQLKIVNEKQKVIDEQAKQLTQKEEEIAEQRKAAEAERDRLNKEIERIEEQQREKDSAHSEELEKARKDTAKALQEAQEKIRAAEEQELQNELQRLNLDRQTLELKTQQLAFIEKEKMSDEKLKEQDEKLKEYDDKISRSNKQLQEAENNLREIEAEKQKEEEKLEKVKREKEETEERLKQLQKEAEAKKDEAEQNRIKSEIEDINKEKEKNEKDLTDSQQKIQDAEKKIGDLEDEKRKIEKEIITSEREKIAFQIQNIKQQIKENNDEKSEDKTGEHGVGIVSEPIEESAEEVIAPTSDVVIEDATEEETKDDEAKPEEDKTAEDGEKVADGAHGVATDVPPEAQPEQEKPATTTETKKRDTTWLGHLGVGIMLFGAIMMLLATILAPWLAAVGVVAIAAGAATKATAVALNGTTYTLNKAAAKAKDMQDVKDAKEFGLSKEQIKKLKKEAWKNSIKFRMKERALDKRMENIESNIKSLKTAEDMYDHYPNMTNLQMVEFEKNSIFEKKAKNFEAENELKAMLANGNSFLLKEIIKAKGGKDSPETKRFIDNYSDAIAMMLVRKANSPEFKVEVKDIINALGPVNGLIIEDKLKDIKKESILLPLMIDEKAKQIDKLKKQINATSKALERAEQEYKNEIDEKAKAEKRGTLLKELEKGKMLQMALQNEEILFNATQQKAKVLFGDDALKLTAKGTMDEARLNIAKTFHEAEKQMDAHFYEEVFSNESSISNAIANSTFREMSTDEQNELIKAFEDQAAGNATREQLELIKKYRKKAALISLSDSSDPVIENIREQIENTQIDEKITTDSEEIKSDVATIEAAFSKEEAERARDIATAISTNDESAFLKNDSQYDPKKQSKKTKKSSTPSRDR